MKGVFIIENLKKLQEMARSGELSKKLLEDEKFKSGLKEILKKEGGAEVTDEEIPEVIKHLESVLQDEITLNEAELETVSGGGRNYTTREKAYIAGGVVGGTAGAIGLTALVLSRCKNWQKALRKECKRYNKAVIRNNINKICFGTEMYNVPAELQAGPIHASGLVGGAVGAGLGLGIAHLICNAAGVK